MNAQEKVQHQLQVLMEGVDDAWLFNSQPNLPSLGEHVTIFDEAGHSVIEGVVAHVSWSYIEERSGSTCTITLRKSG